MSLQDLAGELHRLTELATQPRALDEVLSRALLALGEVVPYDLAALFELRDGVLHVKAAEGQLAGAKVRQHRLRLADYPTIRRAMHLRRPIPLEAHHHAGDEGDPYDGVLDLPHGHSCMVVPLAAGDRDLGLITLDRRHCEPYSASAVDVASVFGQLVSTALLFAEQAALLDRYRHRLREHTANLEAELGDGATAARNLEASQAPQMRALVCQARAVAPTEVPVLLQGETGTGKEVLARALHQWSPRAPGPFVKLNCAAIPDNLVESELFGHVRGAFSGAVRAREGRFATANGGTLLLDEIGDMPLGLQAKLLRVLQEGVFEPVGSDRSVKVDVRVLAASHVDLQQAVREGRFREDLYYRLAVFPMHLPPLRERREDVVPIARSWLVDQHERTGRGPWQLSGKAAQALTGSAWPGNVRQLVNVLERATILLPQGILEPEHLGCGAPVAPTPSSAHTGPLPTYEDNEVAYFRAVLEQADGHVYGDGGAAEITGLKPTTLQSKLKKRALR